MTAPNAYGSSGLTDGAVKMEKDANNIKRRFVHSFTYSQRIISMNTLKAVCMWCFAMPGS